MKNKLKLALLLTSIVSSSSAFAKASADAKSQLNVVTNNTLGTLQDIKDPIEGAMRMSQLKRIENATNEGFTDLTAAIDYLTDEIGGASAHPLIDTLDIATNYDVEFKFTASQSLPFFMRDAEFKFIKSVSAKDNNTLVWECRTNVDKGYYELANRPATGSVSKVISEITEVPEIFAGCKYDPFES